MTKQADIGILGLAVMGQNLVLNLEEKGFKVAVFNRSFEKTEAFVKGPAAGKEIYPSKDLKEFVQHLSAPRKIMLMVKAGEVVDQFIEQLLPLLSKGDIIIDGGNSYFLDTNRRAQYLEEKGLLFVGAGVSGGEEGARHGPSIMPGGNSKAWPHLREIFQRICAQVKKEDRSELASTGNSGHFIKVAQAGDLEPCCEWIGPEGSGHFVKMVHNGIEYADMQLIAEGYDVMHRLLGMTAREMSEVFAKWNQGILKSFLVEITADILAKEDEDGSPLIHKILDVAGQKGTGKWTVDSALELGVPVSLISEAVCSRFLSSFKALRKEAATKLVAVEGAQSREPLNREMVLGWLEHALYASKIVSYAQGFMMMDEAQKRYGWNLKLNEIAKLWRGGCIIRSQFLNPISDAFTGEKPSNLMLSAFFQNSLARTQIGWRSLVALMAVEGIPVSCISNALSFYDNLRSETLPANLLQGMRDYFGAHTYERRDKPRGEFFHTNWTGKGGKVSASSYNA